jgi:rubredoxin
MKPRHEGETCPDCGFLKLRFIQFQEYNGAREEVYYCSNCDYIKFKI